MTINVAHVVGITISGWDGLLWVVVSAMGLGAAYLRAPQWKAFVLVLPLPFTVAVLAVGEPIGASHLLALNVLLAYTHGVRWLHHKGWSIGLAIAACAAGYCLVGLILNPWLPGNPSVFWLLWVLTLGVAGLVHARFRADAGTAYRSPLPVWSKLIVITMVVAGLVALKHLLQGFTAFFPMVGVLVAYEARHSLRVVCWQIPLFIFAALPMLAAIYVAQSRWPLGVALGVGWALFVPLMIFIQWVARRRMASTAARSRNPPPGDDP